jgi:UDP-N-acetyl-D-mannosaminuronic acid transferase (WecB/TagA/CpsF family)
MGAIEVFGSPALAESWIMENLDGIVGAIALSCQAIFNAMSGVICRAPGTKTINNQKQQSAILLCVSALPW